MSEQTKLVDFSADAPIKSADEDLLNRAGFAKSIARAIQAWKRNESLVIGLSGEWGAGKSSLKNMIVEAALTGKDRLDVLEFNPWQWSGQDRLFQGFFDELSIALGRPASTERKKLAQKIKHYGQLLETAAHSFSGTATAIPYLLTATMFLGIVAAFPFINLASKVITVVAWLLAGSAVMTWGAGLASRIGDAMQTKANIADGTLDATKGEIRELLLKLERPLLVIVDDIDRLSKGEARLLVQLVKANSDFPNLVFLLLYSRTVLESFLESKSVSGADYLKKIVQVPFDVPSVKQNRIDAVLFARLDGVLAAVTAAGKFDETRWGNLYYGSLQKYFDDLRDVYRYVATLAFHANIFSGEVVFEVNVIDLLGIEALRVFEPEVYSKVRAAKTLLTGPESWRDEKAKKSEADEIVTGLSESRRDNVLKLLKLLFPRLEALYGGSHYGGDWDETWMQEARICVAQKFDRYFQLALPDDDLSESDISRLIESTSSYEGFRQELEALRARGLVAPAFVQLDVYKQKIPLSSAAEFLPALLDEGDDLPEAGGELFLSPSMRAARVLYWYLLQEPDQSKRSALLDDAFSMATGLSLVAGEVQTEDDRKKKGETNLLLDDISREKLRRGVVQKIESLAKNPDTFLKNGSAAFLLFRWLEWGEELEVRKWAEQTFSSPKMALLLLVALTGRGTTQSVNDYVARIRWSIPIDALEKIVPSAVIESVLSGIEPKNLPVEQRRSVEAFRAAVEERAKKTGSTDLDVRSTRDDEGTDL